MTGTALIRTVLDDALANGAHLIGEALELDPATRGLLASHPDQVHLLPAADATLVGLAVGMTLAGKRAIVDLSGPDALWGALQQLGQEAATVGRTGEFSAPLVLRVPIGPTEFDPGALLRAVEGISVAVAATPGDAAGLLRAALQADHPVVLLEVRDVLARSTKDSETTIALGTASIARTGDHATVLAWGSAVSAALTAADTLAVEGISTEVVDVRSLRPLDIATITQSVQKTGRVVIAGDTPGVLEAAVCGAFLYLESPPTTTGPQATALAQTVREAVCY